MSIAAVIADMVRAGVDPDLIGRAAEAMASAAHVDHQAERRRAKDRERKANVRGIPRNSADSADTASPEQKGFPTPLPKTQPLKPSEPKGSSGITTRVREAAFAEFWRAYPNRVGKGAAAKAFDRALGKIGGPDPLSVLLLGLERAKAMWRDPRFIPHPATWLNQERWNDEPPETQDHPTRPTDDRQPSRHDRQRSEYADRLSRIDAAMAAAVEPPSG